MGSDVIKWLLIVGAVCWSVAEIWAATHNSAGDDPLTISQMFWRFTGKHKWWKLIFAAASLALFYHLFIQKEIKQEPLLPVIQIEDQWKS